MYTIELTLNGHRNTKKRRFRTREEAMLSWDNAVEWAQGGDKLRLTGPEGAVMSEYNPVAYKGAQDT
jgi:hypothetical protein